MPKKPGVDPADTRRHILQSAIELFGRKGRDGVSIRTIGKHAGVTLGAVHHHFGSKDELYEEALQTVKIGVGEIWGGLLDEYRGEDERGRVENAARMAVRISFEHSHRSRLLLRHFLDNPEDPDDSLVEEEREKLNEHAELIAKLTGRTVIDARIRLHALLFAVGRIAVMSRSERAFATETEDEAECNELIEASMTDMIVQTLF